VSEHQGAHGLVGVPVRGVHVIVIVVMPVIVIVCVLGGGSVLVVVRVARSVFVRVVMGRGSPVLAVFVRVVVPVSGFMGVVVRVARVVRMSVFVRVPVVVPESGGPVAPGPP
jgi:hypothetical protein